jgi:beta-galactosidase GanA
MNLKQLPILLIGFYFLSFSQAKAQDNLAMPRLAQKNGRTQLLVNHQSFIITGGELGNSTASSTAYMQQFWPKLEKMNLNTVVAPVYWELMEPQEGRFNFGLVDDLIRDARKHHIKLVLLWFGTWKNSMSCYAPEWMKVDQARFPRTQSSNGTKAEIISPFSKNALLADKAAFTKLLQHIKQTDAQQHTVLMIQVENEIGMLPEARDHSPIADAAFNQPVPELLINYLSANRTILLPEVKQRWENNGAKTNGNWETIFGKGPATDEIFMAWYFGRYVDEVARAGKAIYPLPMYLNAALNAPGKKPGEYPSAGPLPHVMDIWKAAAPAIDMLSPDFYNPDFAHWNDLYTRIANPLFIPEHRFEAGVEAKAFYAVGHYHALGFSPFAIESKPVADGERLSQAYSIIRALTPTISSVAIDKVDGVLLSKNQDSTQLIMGDYKLTIKHDYTLSWAPKPADGRWPLTGGIIIGIANDEFYIAGTGLVVTFKPLTSGKRAGIIRVDEGTFVSGKWSPGRRLNGDEDHQGRHVSIPASSLGIQRVKLYTY